MLKGGTGRILRVEATDGEIKPGSPVSVLAEGIAWLSDEAMPREALQLAPLQEFAVGPVYLTVNEHSEIFVGGRTNDGEAAVYKIVRKCFQWWKFYCLYRC